MPPKLNLKKRLLFVLLVSFSLIFTLISAMTAIGLTSSEKTAIPMQLVLSLLMLSSWGVSSYIAYRFHLREVTVFQIIFWGCAVVAYLLLCIISDLPGELPAFAGVLTAVLGIPMAGYYALIDILGIQNQVGCIVLTLIPAGALIAVNGRFLKKPYLPKPKKQPALSVAVPANKKDKRHEKR